MKKNIINGAVQQLVEAGITNSTINVSNYGIIKKEKNSNRFCIHFLQLTRRVEEMYRKPRLCL